MNRVQSCLFALALHPAFGLNTGYETLVLDGQGGARKLLSPTVRPDDQPYWAAADCATSWLGKQQAGLSLARLAHSRNPASAHHIVALARCQATLGYSQEALSTLSRLPSQGDRNLWVASTLARTLSLAGYRTGNSAHIQNALTVLDSALQKANSSPALHFQRGNALRLLRRYPEALAAAERALNLRPTHSGALVERGIAHRRLGKPEQAIADFQAAAQADPSNPYPHYQLGLTAFQGKNHEAAAVHYQRALELGPDDAHTSSDLADVFGYLGRAEQGLAHAIRSIELSYQFSPQMLPTAYWIAGKLYFEQERYDEALKAADYAMASGPNFDGGYVLRANVLRIRRQYREAISYYTKALALDPNCTACYEFRAQCYFEAGDAVRATQDLARVPHATGLAHPLVRRAYELFARIPVTSACFDTLSGVFGVSYPDAAQDPYGVRRQQATERARADYQRKVAKCASDKALRFEAFDSIAQSLPAAGATRRKLVSELRNLMEDSPYADNFTAWEAANGRLQ